MMPRLSALQTIWLMTRMRCLRQRNLLLHALLRGFGRKAARDGNGGKRSTSWILGGLVAVTMAISLLSISSNIVLNLQCHMVSSSACHHSSPDLGGAARNRIAAAELEKAASFAPPLQHALALELGALFLVSVLLSLGSKELAQPDWDLEWLVTLPASRSSLLWGRVVERSAANLIGIFLLGAAYGMIAWYGGKGWASAPLALLAAIALLPLSAIVQTLADTGLRMALPASQLRNLQALISLLGLPLMYLVIATSMPEASSFIMDWARASPAWLMWTPPGLLLQAMQAPGSSALITSLCLFALQSIVLLWGGVILLSYQLRHGVVRSGARESARRIAVGGAAQTPVRSMAQAAPHSGSQQAGWLERLLSPIQRRELRLLSRDRNFLVQTLVLPLVIVFSQLIFNGKLDSLAELGQHHAATAAIAFSIGAYVLMLSAFQTLNNEGQVLWLLYTMPQSLNDILKQKARLWAVLGLLYPLAVFAIGAYYSTAYTWSMLIPLLTALVGIPIYSILAVALGVFACNPHAVDTRHKVKPTFVYLYMLLASFYIWSITASFWWQKLIVTVLITSMALALWQKARDAMPYLLDPAAAPPARVALADGLIGATAFFILQGVAVLIIADDPGTVDMRATTLGFISAGILVYVLMRLYYWRARTAGVPAILRGTQLVTTLQAVLPAAALAIAAGLLAQSVIRHSDYAPMLHLKVDGSPTLQYWLLGLTVLAAPLCEEFIFRGLIFGGLRRTLTPLLSALVSAAIFAVVHPPLSMLPVFVLGLCTAWAYQRSQTLLAPMLVHALYNAAVVSALLLG
ncbi:CPBP family intramembrane metalloprotease [Pseudoduganella sp. FT93W]|uniref:CPBP family intramembrane metalloprotease n=1 Tax=Duganella fentianensis TaxID=2692177 RepID=A0A845I4L4_9BURK|nr:CPBP family intramembrane glutamic endopeptidase [Duganella fentianensis]MYN46945.1 CPBP family intramembrane metalloprotease [Duganella fentianensis]